MGVGLLVLFFSAVSAIYVQQGAKLRSTGVSASARQGQFVALSYDGSIMAVGNPSGSV